MIKKFPAHLQWRRAWQRLVDTRTDSAGLSHGPRCLPQAAQGEELSPATEPPEGPL